MAAGSSQPIRMKRCSRLGRFFTARKRKFIGKSLAWKLINIETGELSSLDGFREMAREEIVVFFKHPEYVAKVISARMRIRCVKRFRELFTLEIETRGHKYLALQGNPCPRWLMMRKRSSRLGLPCQNVAVIRVMIVFRQGTSVTDQTSSCNHHRHKNRTTRDLDRRNLNARHLWVGVSESESWQRYELVAAGGV